MRTKIKSKRKILRYTIMYARVPYYTKIKSKRKFKLRNIKLSKISLPMGDLVIHYTTSIIPGAHSRLNKFLIMQLCCKFVLRYLVIVIHIHCSVF